MTTLTPPVMTGRYGFRQVARMEWIKLRSLRSTAWTLLFALAGTVAAGITAGFNTSNPHGDPTNNILAGIALGQIVIGVLGVLVMTSEYTSGMIRATLAGVPRRPLVLAAKAAVFGAVALAAGEAASFISLLAGASFSLIGLLGLGLGAIIRHTAAAIAVLVGGVYLAAQLAGAVAQGAAAYMPVLIIGNSLSTTKP